MVTIDNIREEIIDKYGFEGELIDYREYGNGHINDTILIQFKHDNGDIMKYVLQRINTHIFTKPVELMENIVNVTEFLKNKIEERGGNPKRETLNVILTGDGKSHLVDSDGDYWRVYDFIDDAISYDKVETPDDFYQSAVAFGNFQNLLADYPANTLHETIEGFHDTKKRFKNFKETVAKNASGRAAEVQREIDFVLEREDLANYFTDMQEKGELPLRVTHNDTKLNNVMIDNETKTGICVVDLDTVMPGLAMNDFGDAIRFGASSAAEDEKDLDKVYMDLELFEVFTKGFIEALDGRLTDIEIDHLPMGAKMMTYECGLRFLADHIDGDNYFKIAREGHNLDRARTQFKLVSDMEAKWEQMKDIVNKYR
ncbi:MAG: aminoglycoside phosphotransferase family protein [Tissierellia bacterium]|nr:aminoglycoside phosphotransferase family protein [Tissierellia bacterium]